MIQVHTHVVIPEHLADDSVTRRGLFAQAADHMSRQAAAINLRVDADTVTSVVVRPAPVESGRSGTDTVFLLGSGALVELPGDSVLWEFTATASPAEDRAASPVEASTEPVAPSPVPSGSPSFDEAVRAMARAKGHDVADDAAVTVEMTGEWSGYSEYTITNTWDEFTIHVAGVAEAFVYSTEDERREDWRLGSTDSSPRAALAKLWDDLAATR